MRPTTVLSTIVVAAFSLTALAQPTVTLTLESSQAGLTVPPGTAIDWTIAVSVSSGDNEGLALVSCDLVQDTGNPGLFDLPPGDVGSIDATMQNFNRPLGISNPGEGGATTGYVGVQRGTAGEMNLVQIGGGQNTFGVALPPGTGIGESADIIPGVGQTGPQTVLSGSFTAPATAGAYAFSLTNALANVITELNAPPAFSPVTNAAVTLDAGTFSVTVGSGYPLGDLNCDGAVNAYDIDAFILAVSSYPDFGAYYEQYPDCDPMLADCNGDGIVNAYDIDAFIALVGGGG